MTDVEALSYSIDAWADAVEMTDTPKASGPMRQAAAVLREQAAIIADRDLKIAALRILIRDAITAFDDGGDYKLARFLISQAFAEAES